MDDPRIDLNPNKLVQYLDKPPEEFTKKDLVKFISENEIQMINFRYVGGDGRLKKLNFVINNKAQLDSLLSVGERVDGSSLFSFVDASSSDLYVVPRYKTAFVNPFSSLPAVDILCTYFANDGTPLSSSAENILKKAGAVLKEKTGMELYAMGELEYYVFYEATDPYPVEPQKGYHESSPFSKWEQLRYEAMRTIAEAGGNIKYGHSEVGTVCGEEFEMEQHEIEFMPVPLEVLVGHAGSGLHVHSKLVKDGRNMMVENEALSDVARKAIAGYLDLAGSLTAFGNTVPISYLRLVPHQEAPTNICWGDRNRSVLVRVPLGWLGVENMINIVNPQEKRTDSSSGMENQTVEFRSPDGSANIYLLLAGLAVAARHGIEMENALDFASKLYVDVNIFHDEYSDLRDKLPQLPASCDESANRLLAARDIYEKNGVFPATVIEDVARTLKSYNDSDLSERLYGHEDEVKKLVDQFIHVT
jgi:glutamine synthetase